MEMIRNQTNFGPRLNTGSAQLWKTSRDIGIASSRANTTRANFNANGYGKYLGMMYDCGRIYPDSVEDLENSDSYFTFVGVTAYDVGYWAFKVLVLTKYP